MTPDTATIATVISCLAALVTAATAGMAKIIRELRKISNGNMQRIDEHLEHLIKLEKANLAAAGRMLKSFESLRHELSASPAKACAKEPAGRKQPRKSAKQGIVRQDKATIRKGAGGDGEN